MKHQVRTVASQFLRPSRGALLLAALLGVAPLAGGCSTSHAEAKLALMADDGRHDFAQTFDHAYTSKDSAGNTQVVLTKETAPDVDQDPQRPLTPTVMAPRQIVKMTVFWRPLSGTRADHPAATNASIHWYLFGDPGSNDVVEYTGSGLVYYKEHADGTKLIVRQAFLRPTAPRGHMADPLGPSTLRGVIYATADESHVKAVLSELKATLAPPAAASAQATPRRRAAVANAAPLAAQASVQ